MNLDFETYSEGGYRFDIAARRFKSLSTQAKSPKRGIALVGSYVYAEHPSARVLVACYSFDGGATVRTWAPGDPPPQDMLDHVARGGLVVAQNSFFEWCVWNLVCVKKYGWPPLRIENTRDTMAKSMAWSLPGALEKVSAILFGESEKDLVGNKIMKKLSAPRSPTKKDTRLKYERESTEEWARLDSYCAQDVRAEVNIGNATPDLSPAELEVWKLDQKINARGIGVDPPLVDACLKIMAEARLRAADELSEITGGRVRAVSEATKILKYTNDSPGAPFLKNLKELVLLEYLSNYGETLNPSVKKVLEIRRDVGGSAPSKLAAMKYRAASDGRVHGAYAYAGAQRTRRWAGRGIQTQNMPNGGPELSKCGYCGAIGALPAQCPQCGNNGAVHEWDIESVEAVIPSLYPGDFDAVNARWGNPAKLIAGCLRSMLVPAPGFEYISSDYSAIEAVVMACMAGEQWIIDVFFGDGKLYERTAEKISGVSVEEILEHKEATGAHHPMRKIGKVGSLASQFAGGLGAWLNLGAGKFMSNQEIRAAVKAWRAGAPNVKHYWYAIEDAALNAVKYPGQIFPVVRRDGLDSHTYLQKLGRALYYVLPNGEFLTYMDAKIESKAKMSGDGWELIKLCDDVPENTPQILQVCTRYPGLLQALYAAEFKITTAIRKEIESIFWEWKDTLIYWGVGENGGWVEQETYGGKLSENSTQSIARFIMAPAMLRAEAAGYPVVMHTHDEICSEIPEGTGSVEEYERLMGIMPEWAKLPDGRAWPIKAAGGWRGKRYRK